MKHFKITKCFLGLGHEGYDDHREALDWYKDVRESEAIKRSRPLQPKALEEIGKKISTQIQNSQELKEAKFFYRSKNSSYQEKL